MFVIKDKLLDKLSYFMYLPPIYAYYLLYYVILNIDVYLEVIEYI